MHFCDTHIHLSGWVGAAGVDVCLAEAGVAGIHSLIQPGVRIADWDEMLRLAERHPQVYLAPGLHPCHADEWDDEADQRLRILARHPKVVALGEIGLDSAAVSPIDVQEKVLRAQLRIALDAGLPVILHSRDKNGVLLNILRELDIGQRVGGVWHAFSAGLAFARQVVARGISLGVGPILLRNNVRKLPDAVAGLPAGALVLETDYPDMAADPVDLLKVAAKVALLRNISLEETAQITTDNARRLFPKLQDNNR